MLRILIDAAVFVYCFVLILGCFEADVSMVAAGEAPFYTIKLPVSAQATPTVNCDINAICFGNFLLNFPQEIAAEKCDLRYQMAMITERY